MDFNFFCIEKYSGSFPPMLFFQEKDCGAVVQLGQNARLGTTFLLRKETLAKESAGTRVVPGSNPGSPTFMVKEC